MPTLSSQETSGVYIRSIIVLLFGVLAVSTGAVLIKMCKLSPLTVGAYRLSLGLPIFWFWAVRIDGAWWKKLQKIDFFWLFLSGILLGLHFATWIASLSYTSVTSSVVLVTTNPIFVGIGSALLLKESVSKNLWIGTILAFGGSVLVALGSPTESTLAPLPWLGNTLALSGALCMSGYLLLGRKLSATLSTASYVAGVYTVAALTLWLGVLGTSSSVIGFTTKQWVLLALLALVPQGIGHTLLNHSLKKMKTSVVAIAILAEPVFATLLAIPMLGEFPTTQQVWGGLAVILGVAYGTRNTKK